MPTILLRRGTSAEWASANPVLAAGELGVDLTLDQIKLGNGVDTWTVLPFMGGGGGGGATWGTITGDLSSQADLQAVLDTLQTEIDSKADLSWDYYAVNWSTKPTLVGSVVAGDVYSYVLGGVTRYRLVPATYNAAQDAFYANFTTGTLSGFIVARG